MKYLLNKDTCLYICNAYYPWQGEPMNAQKILSGLFQTIKLHYLDIRHQGCSEPGERLLIRSFIREFIQNKEIVVRFTSCTNKSISCRINSEIL